MIYRVIIKVGYYEAYFEFNESEKACEFATTALAHMTSNEDTKKKSSIALEIVDPALEESEED